MTLVAKSNNIDVTHWPGKGAIAQAIRSPNVGRGRCVSYIQLAAQSGSIDAQKWMTAYRSLKPYEQKLVAFEDICLATGVKASVLMGLMVSAATAHGMETSNLLAATLQPRVVQALATSAVRTTGVYAEIAQKDRFAFLQNRGMLPMPRGVQINVSANANAAAKASENPSVPTFFEDMRSLEAAKEGVQKQLGEGEGKPSHGDPIAMERDHLLDLADDHSGRRYALPTPPTDTLDDYDHEGEAPED